MLVMFVTVVIVFAISTDCKLEQDSNKLAKEVMFPNSRSLACSRIRLWATFVVLPPRVREVMVEDAISNSR